MSGLHVVLLDDHRLLSQALAMALAGAGHRAEVLDPSAGAGVIVAAVTAAAPDVVVLDLHLGAADPTGGDRLVAALAPARAVLVLTSETDGARWGRCLRDGARGVVSKEAPLADVVAAVAAAAGGAVLPDAERSALLRAAERAEREEVTRLAPFRQLTPRELDVLDALVDGTTAGEIARAASVSEATVRTQIRAVLTKLGVRSQLAAAAAARRAGWARDAA